MEEVDDGQCSVVYFCPGSDHEISALYRPDSPPVLAPHDRIKRPSLASVYSNVRRLLDVDQGSFRQGETLFHTHYAPHIDSLQSLPAPNRTNASAVCLLSLSRAILSY